MYIYITDVDRDVQRTKRTDCSRESLEMPDKYKRMTEFRWER